MPTTTAHSRVATATVGIAPDESKASTGRRLLTLMALIGTYLVYREVRVGAGRNTMVEGLPIVPFQHALTVLKVERILRLNVERSWQRLALSNRILVDFCNAYYSWMHQIMTVALLAAIVLNAPWPQARRWATGLVLQLPIALIAFRSYELMPPRLLDGGAPWGGRILATHRHLHPTGFVDTLIEFRGPWTPGPVSLHAFTNQYAAMPSLHCAFALWVGIVWWKWAKGKRWRVIGPIHTFLIFWCVIVTANHYVLDCVAGWLLAISTLALAHLMPAPRSRPMTRTKSELHAGPTARPPRQIRGCAATDAPSAHRCRATTPIA